MITCTSNHIERVIYNYSRRQRNDEVRFEVALTHAKRHSNRSQIFTRVHLSKLAFTLAHTPAHHQSSINDPHSCALSLCLPLSLSRTNKQTSHKTRILIRSSSQPLASLVAHLHNHAPHRPAHTKTHRHSPPDTGASMNDPPASAAAAAISTDTAGSMVEESMQSVPGDIAPNTLQATKTERESVGRGRSQHDEANVNAASEMALTNQQPKGHWPESKEGWCREVEAPLTPVSASVYTLRTCGLDGTIDMTTAAPAAASAGDDATLAPKALSRSAAAGDTSKTVTDRPACCVAVMGDNIRMGKQKCKLVLPMHVLFTRLVCSGQVDTVGR